jgi:N6-adenosine-specific RNA methylase IME4/ParB-like chromosome segregation protein Spo0J
MQPHAVASLFPMMSEEEYRALVEDVRTHGQREPIWTLDNAIIDGRNRWRACEELGITPATREYQGDASMSVLVSFVLSLNLKRRHLSSSQKAVIALEVEQLLATEARERQRGGQGGILLPQNFAEAKGESREQAAAIVGSNRQYVSDAKKLASEAPELLEKVRSGELSIPQAKQEYKAQFAPPPIPVPDYDDEEWEDDEPLSDYEEQVAKEAFKEPSFDDFSDQQKEMINELSDKLQSMSPSEVPVVIQGRTKVTFSPQPDYAPVTGVNQQYVTDAKKLSEQAPALFERVRTGEMTIPQAKQEHKKQERLQRIYDLNSQGDELLQSDKKYRVIYADPPWMYGNNMPDYFDEQAHHYPLMTVREICEMPIRDLAIDDAVLFLWVTSPILAEAFDVIRSWGFTYKSSFVWDKIKHNMGHYNSVRHELLLICTRGSCQPDVQKLFDSVQSIERTRHSEKPEFFREIIDTIYPLGPRIELFARTTTEGWDSYGNEAVAIDALSGQS